MSEGHKTWTCPAGHKWTNVVPVLAATCGKCYPDSKVNRPAMKPVTTKGK
jgi:hypothetical protein